MCEPVTPVVAGLEPYEIVYAKDQPEYAPLAVLRSPQGVTLSRWVLTDDERAAIAAGADLYLSVHTFFHPLQAMAIQVAFPCDAEQMEREWQLKEELDLRLAAAQRDEARKRTAESS